MEDRRGTRDILKAESIRLNSRLDVGSEEKDRKMVLIPLICMQSKG